MSEIEPDDPPSDYDSPWKSALDRYFAPFISLHWPDLHARIDWRQAPQFLDKELQQVVRDADSGRRYADKLVLVATHEHGPRLVLIHIEIEGRGGNAFAARMYRYRYRLRDTYPDAVIETLAVLTHRRQGSAFLVYREAGLYSTVEFRFPVVNLSAWLKRWSELEAAAPDNPFAIVVMAQLLALHDGKPLASSKLRGKLKLARMLYRYGYDRQDVLELFRLIDWMITLPADEEARFVAVEARLERNTKMGYVSSAERVGQRKGRQEGLQEGRQEGQQAILQRVLSRRFGVLPPWAEARLAQAGSAELLDWADRVLDATSLEEVLGGAPPVST